MYKDQDILKKLGGRIKDLRVKAGYTSHEKFANEIDISRAQYWSYEQGTNMNFLTLVKILNFHKISLEDFFEEGFE
jgi:transcriptional regulator with XRE-family HTH domain